MESTESTEQQTVSETVDTVNNGIQDGGPPLVFVRESSLFGQRKPHYSEYLKHEEMYNSIAKTIDPTHITGLQRVNGLWRLYLDNLTDKTKLMTEGVTVRGRTLPVLQTNPFRLDFEDTTRIRVQDIPLSVDDGMITRVFVLKGLDVISNTREKLRINSKLTNCDTGDRLVMVKTSSLKEPLNRFMYIGKYKAKVIHRNQNKNTKGSPKCMNCLEPGHHASTCENEVRCMQCKGSGHRKGDCPINGLMMEEPTRSDDSTQQEDVVNQQTDLSLSDSSGTRDDTSTSTSTRTVLKPKHTANDKKKPASEVPKGQSRMDKFVQCEGATPSRDRSKSRPRSPPTPAEMLHDNSKKSRQHGERDSD